MPGGGITEEENEGPADEPCRKLLEQRGWLSLDVVSKSAARVSSICRRRERLIPSKILYSN
jgi:hypothetical protein